MKVWQILYTNRALTDLETVYEYIAFVLQEPQKAQRQVNAIMDAVDQLDHMPFRYRLYPVEPWASRGLRVLTILNYLVFYLPDEQNSTIAIIRILYDGRDIASELNR